MKLSSAHSEGAFFIPVQSRFLEVIYSQGYKKVKI